MCSFALWHDGQLIAGEFGALVGKSYTSYSGFYRMDGAGAAQMALTAMVLERAGFEFWDMGQEHEYKLKHGASLVPRHVFLDGFRRARCGLNGLDALARQHGGRFSGEELMRQQALRQEAATGGEATGGEATGGEATGGETATGRGSARMHGGGESDDPIDEGDYSEDGAAVTNRARPAAPRSFRAGPSGELEVVT